MFFNEAKRVMVVSAVMIACISAGILFWFGSFSAASAVYFSRPIRLDPSVLDLGIRDVDDVAKVSIAIVNQVHVPVKIVGLATTCSCLVVNDGNFVIEPGKTVECPLEVHMNLPIGSNEYSQEIMVTAQWNGAIVQEKGVIRATVTKKPPSSP